MEFKLHRILFLSITVHLFSCYFNPVVNSLLVPAEEESNSSLGLLALNGIDSPTTGLKVVGQIKNLSSVNIPFPKLSVESVNAASQNNSFISSTLGNASGKFLVSLPIGSFLITVSNATGTIIGSFTLTISSDLVLTKQDISGSSFMVVNLLSYPLGEDVLLTEDPVPIVRPAPIISNFSPSSGCTTSITILGTNFSRNSSEITVTGSACTFGSIISATFTQIEIPVTSVSNDCTITVTIDGQSGSSASQFINMC
jgi:hypothetical protein